MAVDASAPGAGPILRFQAAPPSAPTDGVRVVVLDTSWTRDPAAGETSPLGLRDVAARVLADRDFLAESATCLDAWATASAVVPLMAIDGTSFWYQGRVRHGLWLHERLLWLALVDDLARTVRPSAIECAPGCDEALLSVAASVAARDGIPFRPDPEISATSTSAAAGVSVAARSSPAAAPGPRARSKRPGLLQRIRRRLPLPLQASESVRRQRIIGGRFDRLSRDPGRLLVVMTHARQRVETPSGPRLMNAYLGPVVDRLRGTRLEPVGLELRSKLSDPATLERFESPDADRVLPGDVVWTAPTGDDPAELGRRAAAVADRVQASGAALVVAGVDLGPDLTRRVADQVRSTFAHTLSSVHRNRLVVDRLRPAMILLADEYHRQDWIVVARTAGIPIVAIQHGLIYRWHNGYMHRDRPAELQLVDRTYVFGEWERRLLIEHSAYRDDEVRVGGSPRLDLAGPLADDERDAVRAELGVAPGHRLVVLSGTWGPIFRRFHYPIALASLFDRSLPDVHLVVKLHPGEPDEGPYRSVIEGVAAAGGFAPPPMSFVQAVDLYRLLRAADAHIGVQSTVLTEAVVTGTPNLLAATAAASDLLGYVDAKVAIAVRTGGDLLAALDAGSAAVPTAEARQAFIDAHFEPGSASDRIAQELLAWPS